MLRYDMLAATEDAACMLLHLVSVTWYSAPLEKCIALMFNDMDNEVAPCAYGSTACC